MHVYPVHISAMELAAYMETMKLKDADLAEKISRDRSTVTRWRLKRTRPDWAAINLIEEVTKGAVTARDFLAPPVTGDKS